MLRLRNSGINMTEGQPLKLLLAFALPMLVGNVFQQLYSAVDSIVVGKFNGSGALGAIGCTGTVTFLFFSISNGIGSGCGVVTSQYFGAGKNDRVKRALANSAYIMLSAGILMSVIAYAAAPSVLKIMKTPADLMPDAITYIRVNCIGVPLVAVYNYSASMERAMGDSVTPLYFLMLSCAINILLDLFFVCVLNLSVFGAALATILSQMIAGIGCLYTAWKQNPLFHLSRGDFAPDPVVLKRAIKIGLPMAMQWSMIAVSTSLLQTYVNSFDSQAVSAYTMTSRVEQLAHQPYGSLGSALSTYAGQNIGAGRPDRVKKGVKQSALLMLGFTLIMTVVMQLCSGTFMKIFLDEAEGADVIALAARGMRILSLFFVALGGIYITRSTLNGAGDVGITLVNGFVELGCRLLIPLLMNLIPGVGVWGIWWTAGLAWLGSCLFCILRYLVWMRKGTQRTRIN